MKILIKTFSVIIIIFLYASNITYASKFNALIAPGSISESSVTVLWDKQYHKSLVKYNVYLNDKFYSYSNKTNITIDNLLPNKCYTIKIFLSGSNEEAILNTVSFKTPTKGKLFNILNFGAKADSTIVNTLAIQSAINACSEGGTVYIPKGTFICGSIYLKSNMTLYIAEGATLKGSKLAKDYMPMILNRFEGWEMETYASLINAGTLNRNGTYNVKNLRITGKGTIIGGGKKLGDEMIKLSGIRSRGRLICLMNCQNVSLSGITVTEPPCWTIHYIYSNNISCYDLRIITHKIRNGDGIDPDSSTDSYIFNCTFDTGDDCIAIKSGKNPEGFFVAKPTKNIRISDCDFIRGHGISIGSEMSGGVSDILIQDCKAGKLLHGMQIKGTKDRGGYVKNITVSDCQLMQITIFSAVNYNNDGEPAPNIPIFENFVFQNIDMSLAASNLFAININGFKNPGHRLKNVRFINVLMPEQAKVAVNDAERVKFLNVKSLIGNKPQYVISNSIDVDY